MTTTLDGYAYSFTSSWGVSNSVFDVVFEVVDYTEVTLTGDADTYVSFGIAEAEIALTGPGGGAFEEFTQSSMTFSFNGMLNPGQYRLRAYTDVNGSSESNLDFVFTISSGVAVSEPGTRLLVGIGLLGFAFRRERKSHDSGNPSGRRSVLLKRVAEAA